MQLSINLKILSVEQQQNSPNRITIIFRTQKFGNPMCILINNVVLRICASVVNYTFEVDKTSLEKNLSRKNQGLPSRVSF